MWPSFVKERCAFTFLRTHTYDICLAEHLIGKQFVIESLRWALLTWDSKQTPRNYWKYTKRHPELLSNSKTVPITQNTLLFIWLLHNTHANVLTWTIKNVCSCTCSSGQNATCQTGNTQSRCLAASLSAQLSWQISLVSPGRCLAREIRAQRRLRRADRMLHYTV